jgi:septum site-determining protein MinC
MNNITIKGSKDGITAYINSNSYDQIKDEFIEKIEGSRSFFSGCNLFIVDNQGYLSQEHYEDLKEMLKETFSIELKYQTKDVLEKNERIFSNIHEGRTKFIKNTIRSGQRINYSGNIVIVGDVNSGAEIIAAGNIVILGILRGIAHAGCTGNKKAYVAAYMLQPAILRIADIIVRAPDDNSERPKIPEVASIKNNMIVVEPYLPNKYK